MYSFSILSKEHYDTLELNLHPRWDNADAPTQCVVVGALEGALAVFSEGTPQQIRKAAQEYIHDNWPQASED